MQDSLFKILGSVRLIQEVTRSNNSIQATNPENFDAEESTIASIEDEEDTSAYLPLSDNQRNSHQWFDGTHTGSFDTILPPSTVDRSLNITEAWPPTVSYFDDEAISLTPMDSETDSEENKESRNEQEIVQQQQQQQRAAWLHMHTHRPNEETEQPLLPLTLDSDLQSQYADSAATFYNILNNPTQTTSSSSSFIQRDTKNRTSRLHSLSHSLRSSASKTNSPARTHNSRRSSKYNIRHHHQYRSDNGLRRYSNSASNYFFRNYSLIPTEGDDIQKNKSQKLLCLWPLPLVTRYMILTATIISSLNAAKIMDLSCFAPSYLYYRYDFKNLLLSPFLFDWTLPNMTLYGWNLLILGLFEESLTLMMGGTRRFVGVLIVLFASVSSIRFLLGYTFSRWTGWQFPSFFFSNSMHECNQGLSPFLFALLIVQSLSMDDKYIVIFGEEDSNHRLTIRKITLQFIMCLMNYFTKNIFWWSISGLLTGCLAIIALQAFLIHKKREESIKVKNANEFASLEHYRRTPTWRIVWTAMKTCGKAVCLAMPVLILWNTYYNIEHLVTPAELNTIATDKPYLFTFIFMTAPRRGDPAYLTRTIESYLANWPEYPSPASPYYRMQAIIYTHFSQHTQYDLAKEYFSNTTKGQRYLRWVREEGSDLNQRLHLSKALSMSTRLYDSAYYVLMEDDFPVCGPHEWHQIENVVYKAATNIPDHCGAFVGTGGSGLFIKPDQARMLTKLLLKYVGEDTPPDIVIQKCLRGELEECSTCTDTLVISKTLLMYHIGYNASTSSDRSYKKNEFQCGWRHPFNGDPSVIVI